MPLIDNIDELAPEQVLVSVPLFQRIEDFATAPRTVVLGRRTPHDLLAVTPGVRDVGAFYGGFQLTHIPTGIAVTTGQTPGRCHEIAVLVADMDWSSITGPDSVTDEFRAAFTERMTHLYRDTNDQWEPDAADRWAEAQAGAPIPSKAVNLAGWSLEGVQEAWNRTFGSDKDDNNVPFYLPDSKSEEYPRGEPNPLWMHWVIRASDLFGVAFLLLVLRRVDPAIADRAATWLAGQWEAGESVGEWSWDFAKIIAEHRYDTADIPTAPPAPGPLLGGTPT